MPRGHAIELRINAEDPAKGFLPVPGTITRFDLPGGPGVRVDSGVTHGDTISGFYDSLMAKLVIWAPDRDRGAGAARQAVKAFRIEGVASVLPFHEAVLHSPDFTKSFSVHTRWIETDFLLSLLNRYALSPVTPRYNVAGLKLMGGAINWLSRPVSRLPPVVLFRQVWLKHPGHYRLPVQ